MYFEKGLLIVVQAENANRTWNLEMKSILCVCVLLLLQG